MENINQNPSMGKQEEIPTRDYFGDDLETIYKRYDIKDEEKKLLKLEKDPGDGNYYWYFKNTLVYLFEQKILEQSEKKDSKGRTLDQIKKESRSLKEEVLQSIVFKNGEFYIQGIPADDWIAKDREQDIKSPYSSHQDN